MANGNIKIEFECRPCFVKGKKALFHKWAHTKNLLGQEFEIGIVEYENGQIEEITPNNIKFCDNKLMNRKKNRVYTATTDEDYGCIYIAAKNIREAKQIALTTWIAETMENYIDLKVKWQKGIETDYEGELSIKQINELGLTWWCCPECDQDKFEIIDDENYKCKNCGNENKIPWANY